MGGRAAQHFHFRALAAGTAGVQFRYSRPWETVAREERHVVITVIDPSS
jgi:predicted secreted protein